MKQEIDFKNDYLLIYKTLEGKFNNWQWLSHIKHTQEELDGMITKYNEEQKTANNGRQVEVITDPLIREICAYRERSKSLEYLTDYIKDFRESIGDIEEKIDDAMNDLNDASSILERIKEAN